jgi:hypothetical protein
MEFLNVSRSFQANWGPSPSLSFCLVLGYTTILICYCVWFQNLDSFCWTCELTLSYLTIINQWNSALFKIVKNCLNTNINSYVYTSGCQYHILNLNVVHFFNTSVNRHLWQLKMFVFLQWCLICAVLLSVT